MVETETLAVLMFGAVVAHVHHRRSAGYRLEYEMQAREPGSTPLSLSLPPAIGTFTGEVVETYLWGLLPEDPRARVAIQRTHAGVNPEKPLSLLSAIGKECAGAVQLCPPEEVDRVAHSVGTLESASLADVEARLSAMRIDPEAGWVMPHEHWSLAGTQSKFGIRHKDGTWWWAHGAQPTTHIVKPGVRELRGQALVEHLTMRAGHHLGLRIARTEFLDFLSERAVVVERFDRAIEAGGAVVRTHQEDVCQALGIRHKYEEYGGPSASAIIRLLRESAATAQQGRDNVNDFVDGLLFNTVIAATDAHARNYALVLKGDQVQFAPLYDVATSLAYDPPGAGARRLSMQIGGTFDAAGVDDNAWRRFARENRLDDDRVLDRVDHLRNGVVDAFEAAVQEVASDDWDGQVSEVAQRLLPSLATHLAR